MAIRKLKPNTNAQRGMSVIDYKKVLTTGNNPVKSLTIKLAKTAGRNFQGKITTRHKGGGHKRLYRIIDFKRNKDNIVANVATIEYDPNRSANIALLNYVDGEKRYILAPEGLKVGDRLVSGNDVDIKVGNALPLSNIPEGSFIHNVELTPGSGAQMARSAGASVQLLGKDDDGKYVTLKLTSGEVRKVLSNGRATIGQVGNGD